MSECDQLQKKIECRFKTNCNRKELNHFVQFSHSHIEKIVQAGKLNGKYVIPSELNFSREIIRLQCEIVEDLVLNNVSKQPEPSKSYFDNFKEEKENKEKVKFEYATDVQEFCPVVAPKGQMAQKLANAAPYNFFLTTVTASTATHSEPLSLIFMELLDESLGELENSVQFNFCVDFAWLMSNYYFAGQDKKPLFVLYGELLNDGETYEFEDILNENQNLTSVKVDFRETAFGIHHSKISILCYKDGSSRIIISTANLYDDDWHNRTQGLWISNQLPAMPDNVHALSGESPTGFRDDFIRYLISYKTPQLQPWITRLRKTDFSSVNVFFVASVHGDNFQHIPNRGPPWGHPRVGHLLQKHAPPIDDSAAIVAQSSSLGSFGRNVRAYCTSEWANSFRRDSANRDNRQMSKFKMIYPSYDNVKNSHDELLAGAGCLPYRREINERQPWLKQHLYQWKSNERHRNQAMPHIKTYARWSDEGLHWFLLTSANMSKSAWGVYDKTARFRTMLNINNYEAGVLFLPNFVFKGETPINAFPLGEDKDGFSKFPMPYDIPLTPYNADDMPFVMEDLEEWLEKQEQDSEDANDDSS